MCPRLAVGELSESSEQKRGDSESSSSSLRQGVSGLLEQGLWAGLTSMATPSSSVSMGAGLSRSERKDGERGGLSGGSCPGLEARGWASGLSLAPGSGLGAGDGSGLSGLGSGSFVLDFLLDVERRRPDVFSFTSGKPIALIMLICSV